MLRLILIAACLTGLVLSDFPPLKEGLFCFSEVTQNYTLLVFQQLKSGEEATLKLTGDGLTGFQLTATDASGNPVGNFRFLNRNILQKPAHWSEGAFLYYGINEDKPIYNLKFVWKAPADYKGNVQFKTIIASDPYGSNICSLQKYVVVQ